MDIPKEDIAALRHEKYGGDLGANMHTDLARLMKGEPLAYVIGTQPFLGLTLHLDSHPLIPRPETEWWAEKLAAYIGNHTLSVLDLCAGSGAIGLALLKHCPNVRVTFADIRADHGRLIEKNLGENNLDAARATVVTGDLFVPLTNRVFDIIATNPPYIPSDRLLPQSVTEYEPADALYGGPDGLSFISRIATEAPNHLNAHGEVWLECDISHVTEAESLFTAHGYTTTVHTDQYDRPRLIVAVLA